MSRAGAPPDRHIVEVLIEERAPKMVASAAWPLWRAVLYPLLRQPEAVRMADAIMALPGRAALDYVSDLLRLAVTVEGLDNVPEEGRVLIAATHPTGIADGVAVYDALKEKRPDLAFFANRDAIRVSPRFEEVMIPVEWVLAKRTRQRSRETLVATKEAFSAGRCVVIFPSGRLAFMDEHKVLIEQEWQSSVAIFARKYECAVVPVHIGARNSWLYYWFRRLGPEFRDITLFNELLNKKGAPFRLTFGKPIPPEDLGGDPEAVAKALREHALEGVPNGAAWRPAEGPIAEMR
jgi:putative hemolysin